MTHSFRLSIYLDFTDSIDFIGRYICSSVPSYPQMKNDFMQTVNLLTIKLQLKVEGSNNLLSRLKKKSLKKSYLFFKTRFEVFFWRPILARGRFLESPGNFSGPKSNILIEKQRIRVGILASKVLHFVSITDSFIMLDTKLLKPLSCM